MDDCERRECRQRSRSSRSANDPQVVAYRPEMLDGSSSVLNWSALDATVASGSNAIQTTRCGIDFTPAGNPIAACLNIPSSTGVNASYFGQTVRITSTGTPVGGLTYYCIDYTYNPPSVRGWSLLGRHSNG